MNNIIINPLTNEKINVYTKNGKELLKKYLIEFNNKNSANVKHIYDVIVIGAGAAGIAAVKHFKDTTDKKEAMDVVILEARDRIGGRIHDIELPDFGKIPLGAAWLHHKGKQPILQKLLDKYNIKYMDSDFLKNSEEMPIYTEKGKLTQEQNKIFSELLQRMPKMLYEYGRNNPKKSVSEAIHILSKDSKLPDTVINALITRATEHCGMNADIMPVGEFDGWEANGQYILDGFSKLLNELAKDMTIELNTEVRNIYQNKKTNVVEINTNNKTYYCRHVISTLPIGVLQSNLVKFKPKLPKDKISALNRLNSGNHEKLFLKFPKLFWDPKIYTFQYSDPKNRGLFTQWYNVLHPAKGKNILYSNLSGPDVKFVKKTKNKLKDLAMKNLRNIFGQNIPEPEAVFMTNWYTDKYTMGGPYAHPNMNGTMGDLSIVGKQFDRIHFAGVDTSETVTETVEAAMLSGIRTANEVKRDFQKN